MIQGLSPVMEDVGGVLYDRDKEIRYEALSAGVVDFLSKPVD